jgi:hypothetical protein
MGKLVQLPDGSWVRTDVVEYIKAMDTFECYPGNFIGPRLVVKFADQYMTHETPSLDEACSLRDKLAAEVNEACDESSLENPLTKEKL